MVTVEIKNLRILHLIFLSIISTAILAITINEIFLTEPNINVSNPDQSGLESGVKFLVYIILLPIGSISAIISIVDLLLEKNRISLINIILAGLIILISFYYK
ncbi:hypothetical protein GCM10023115_24540 [Pontixanthobacter gangjinensis]|uniref:Uncharacterized protein n=1 Tax=Christiangramia aestuarii TaxID=1028746 RepID=A0A7K1LSW3_9FLAO|nr:hypothetical protein [Christiangramia aestuarii]MUP43909.1 hypothetical protein [Christiangramia aestuarii]